MEENFKLEITSPEKIVFSGEVKMVTLPSFEGDMGILKNHISIITFLRPGILKVKLDNENFEEFFVQDGTVEFFENVLSILSASVLNLKNVSKDFINSVNKDTENKLANKDISNHERYILNCKLNVLNQIRV